MGPSTRQVGINGQAAGQVTLSVGDARKVWEVRNLLRSEAKR
jgi:hypothetical protein